MPTPVYIICADSITEDKSSSLFSHFNVIEKIIFTRPEGEVEVQSSLPRLRFRVIAVWRLTENDTPGDEYETLIRILMPQDSNERDSDLLTLRPNPESNLLRIVTQFDGSLPLNEPGLLLVQNHLRRVGTEEWLVQEYPIFVEEQLSTHSAQEDDAVTETASD